MTLLFYSKMSQMFFCFFDYINNKHRNIKFTMEKENQGRLPFLDILIQNPEIGWKLQFIENPTFQV